jgi:putative chitinase
VLAFDPDKFAAAYREQFPKPAETPSPITGCGRLVAKIATDPEIADVRYVAYMLATVKHECANCWRPIEEHGQRPYFEKYETGTPIGARLGNTEPGDGYRYRGRGFVQITGRANYQRLGKQVDQGDRLMDDPELALDFDVAYSIMSLGMRRGSFTGKKLADFIGPGVCDYLHARRIINGLDRASTIEEYAKKLEIALSTSLTS